MADNTEKLSEIIMISNRVKQIVECIKKEWKTKYYCITACICFVIVVLVMMAIAYFVPCCKFWNCCDQSDITVFLKDLTSDNIKLPRCANFDLIYNINDSKISLEKVRIWHDETNDYGRIKNIHICKTIIATIALICIAVMFCIHCKYYHDMQKNCINKIYDAFIADIFKK